MCSGAGRRSRFRRQARRFRRVPACADVDSGGRFRRVPGVCWWFRRVPACAGVGSGEAGSGRFQRVPLCAGVGSGGRFGKVPVSSGVCWCRFRRQVPEGTGEFRCVLV